MSKMINSTRLTGATARTRFPVAMKRLSGLVIMALLLATGPAHAEDPDAQYVSIYALIQQADSLNTSGQAGPALAKYRQAQTNLLTFQKEHSLWNVSVVAFRLKYVAEKVAALSAPPAAVAPTESQAAATASTQVKLLEAGAEPLKVLRLHPSPGDKQSLGLTVKMAMEMKMGAMESPATKIPAIKMTMDASVKSVSADGDITYEMAVGDASIAEDTDVAPQVAEAMKSSLAGVKGLSGTGTTSDRGVYKGTEIKLGSGANAQTRQTIDQLKESFANLTCPLPDEAVGAGAKWEVRMPVKSQGITIDQTTTYQLVSVDGERLTIKSTVAQHAANQKIQNPAMPGAKVDVTKMVGTGTGEVTLDLAQLLPSAGTLDLHSEISMGMNVAGQKQAMDMKMDLKVALEAK